MLAVVQLAEHTSLAVLVFEVGGRRYGLPAADVRELLRMASFVPLPSAPRLVEGVLNVRGELVPVLDLRRRLKLPPKQPTPADYLIVAFCAGRAVALRVEGVAGVLTLEVEELGSVLPGDAPAGSVARMADGLLLIHDLRAFLSSEESADLTVALERASATSRKPK